MKTFLTNPSKKKQAIIMFADGFIVLFALLSSYAFRIVFYEQKYILSIFDRASWIVLAAVFFHIISLYIFELYDLEVKRSDGKTIILIGISITFASTIVAVISYLGPEYKIGRVVLTTHVPLTVILLFFCRKLFFSLFRQEGLNNLMLIGNSSLNQEIIALVNRPTRKDYTLVAKATDYTENPGTIQLNGKAVEQGIAHMVKERNINTIVISQDIKDFPRLRNELLNMKFQGVSIYDAPVFYKKITGKVPVFHVGDAWFLFREDQAIIGARYRKNAKRVMDILIASVSLLIFAPVYFICALTIKLTSRGPVFFKQERLGENEKPYTAFKFRTMVKDAEMETGPKWSSRYDPRITRVGKVLRKTRLDEIPQIINILRGDMSIVGPRPIRKHFADILAEKVPFYRLRFLTKPGLSGWAQVKHEYAGSEDGQIVKLQYDLFYIQNQSFFFDLYIMLKTIQTVLFRPGE